MPDDKSKNVFLVGLEVALNISVPILLASAAWMFFNISDLNKRVVVIETLQPLIVQGQAKTDRQLDSMNDKLGDFKATASVRDERLGSLKAGQEKITELLTDLAKKVENRKP